MSGFAVVVIAALVLSFLLALPPIPAGLYGRPADGAPARTSEPADRPAVAVRSHKVMISAPDYEEVIRSEKMPVCEDCTMARTTQISAAGVITRAVSRTGTTG